MRRSHRLIPSGWDFLEMRLALSHAIAMAPTRGEIQIAVPRGSFAPLPARLTPVEELNREFASFREDVRAASAVDAPRFSADDSIQLSSRSATPQGADHSDGDFPAYVRTRAGVMAENLATFFRSMPARRPGSAEAPGTPRMRPQTIAAQSSDRLTQAVLAIPRPSDPGPDLTRYNAALDRAIAGVRTRAIGGLGPLSPGRPPLARRQAPPSMSAVLPSGRHDPLATSQGG